MFKGENITCDPPIYTMGHPDLTVSNFTGILIGPKTVNLIIKCMYFQQCKGKYQRAILYVSGDALRVVDEISKVRDR